MDADPQSSASVIPRGDLQPPRDWQTPVLKLLALVAICGAIVALLLPALMSARGPDPRHSLCLSNLKHIAIGLDNYASVHGHYPPAYTTDADGNRLHSWRTLILPYVEQQSLYDAIDLTKPWNDPANALASENMPEFYRCPSARDSFAIDEHSTTYLAIVTPDSVLRGGESLTPQQVAPGAANALLVVDAPHDRAVPWMSPADADEQLLLAFGPETKMQHNGDIMLGVYADGHTAALTSDFDEAARRAMITASPDDAIGKR